MRELLVLQPVGGEPPLRFPRLKDYWLILTKLGVSSVLGRRTASTAQCCGLMLAPLVLDEVDFEFDDRGQLPVDLPADLSGYRNILIFSEDFGHWAPRLTDFFPEARTYVAGLAECPHPYRYTSSRDGRCRLYVRPLAKLITAGQWGALYWSMGLTMNSPRFRERQLARADSEVHRQALRRIREDHADPDWIDRYPPCKFGQILGREWTESSAIMQRVYMELGALLGDPWLFGIGAASVRHYLGSTDWARMPRNGDEWSIVKAVACLYQATAESDLRDFILVRLRQRDEHWQQWRGCYGNWPDPPDAWLRDSSLSNMVSAAVHAAAVLADNEVDKAAVYRQAVHQARVSDELLRDPATGWYRFGADGCGRWTPSFATHGSYWYIHAYAMLLVHLPPSTPGYDEVVSIYRRLAAALARAQGPSGMWHTHLDRPESSTGDAGYTAAITGSLLRGLTLGLLDAAEFAPVVRRGRDGVKLRSFAGYLAGGVVACALTPSARYYHNRQQWEELNVGTWQQIFFIAEAIRYDAQVQPGVP